MADSPLSIDNYANDDILLMTAAAVQTPGTEGKVLGVPVMLWGVPGVGKTSRVQKLGKALGFNPTRIILASIRGPSDFLGIPTPGAKATLGKGEGAKTIGVLTFSPPDWAVEAYNGAFGGTPLVPGSPRALIFFDEFTTASPMVMAAMLRVIHERYVGDFALPENVAVLAAANPPAMAPGGTPLSSPVANRFIHLFWKPPTPAEWGGWVQKTQPTATEAADARSEGKTWPRLDVGKFLQFYDQYKMMMAEWIKTPQGSRYLFKMPNSDERDEMNSFFQEHPELSSGTPDGMKREVRFTDMYAWPSPRSLELALRARAGVMALSNVDVVKRSILANEIVCASIGTEACTSFNTFVEGMELYVITPPEDFFTNAEKRAKFFQRSPTDETLRVQLASAINTYKNMPLGQQSELRATFIGAIAAFRSSSISGASATAVYTEYRNWKEGPEGKAALGRLAGSDIQEWEANHGAINQAFRDLLSLKRVEARGGTGAGGPR